MKSLAAAVQLALEAGAVVARDMLRLTARNRIDDSSVVVDYWTGRGDVTALVRTSAGGVESRTFQGGGAFRPIEAVPSVSGLGVQTLEIAARGITRPGETSIEEMVRTFDLRRGSVELHRGLFDPQTDEQIDAAFLRFQGYVDEVNLRTPEEGAEGAIVLTCASYMQELTRSNSEMRSSASQKRRNPSDGFFDDAATVGSWSIKWGAS